MSVTIETATDRMTEPFREKVLRKCAESMETKEKFFATYADSFDEMSRALAERFQKGGRLFVMGNGGSLCDALHIAVEFNHPIIEKRIAFPAVPLMTDIATMTAISNDIDFTRVYVNQLRLQATENDVAMVFSSSGKSPNLIYALEEARAKKMLSIAFSGKDGGRFPEVSDYCYIVPSFSIHRIQEAHATAVHIIWDLVHIALGAEDVT
ncbi:MAG: SIS domain-containing protein [Verrucomicrobiota bacterium]|nr:SIS domain-containing protein [Verrucomicrobiota bacterium]MDQ3545242.1 SIS domain-containing protein [Verrucomicrobiota bacterium]